MTDADADADARAAARARAADACAAGGDGPPPTDAGGGVPSTATDAAGAPRTATDGAPSAAIEDDLAVGIARSRGGAGAGRMARALLARDGEGWLLVGLVDGGERAVFYDPADWRVAAAPFGAGGIDGLGASAVARARHVGRVERYVRDRDDWDWLHPRFRWVRATDEE